MADGRWLDLGLALPMVEVAKRYDGSDVLKRDGRFMAGPATHPSAEPGSLVVRVDAEQRACLLEDAPETYYVTDYYELHPVVLVRLARIDRVALQDVLSMSWRLTARRGKRSP